MFIARSSLRNGIRIGIPTSSLRMTGCGEGSWIITLSVSGTNRRAPAYPLF